VRPRAGAARRILAAGPYRNRFYFGNPLHRENIERALSALGDLSSCAVLDYGCGSRVITTEILAGSAKKVVALDSDFGALKLLRSRLSREARARVLVVASDAHAIAVRDGGFDAAFGLGVLHHLDLSRALPDLARVLRPGARAAFVEPLGHNPLVNLFRRLTPAMRDRDEHPLTLQDLAGAAAIFDDVEHRESQLLSLAALALRGLPWVGERLFNLAIVPLAAADGKLLRWMPALRKYAWTTVITLTRRAATPVPGGAHDPIQAR
jgi:SAM-dependent methyltransferase